MAQKFKDIQSTDYIDTGILDLQDRDDSVLTMFYGDSEPNDKFTDLVWNDTLNKKIKQWNGEEWEELVDYGLNYITQVNVNSNYQPLNSKLTTYSSITSMSSGIGFINTQWIPMSYFFVNNYNDLANGIGLQTLAYRSRLTTSEISNGAIPNSKINPSLITQPVYITGDCIPSFNTGNKTGCIKLSKSAATIYTIGATASGSTYKGETLKNLYHLLWDRFSALGLNIYTSAGVRTNRGSNWSDDWNNNKRLELPHVILPEDNAPAEKKMTSGTNVNYTITKSGYYKMTLVGGGGGSAASSAGTWGHQSACSGASGAGFEGVILLNQGDVLNYTVGAGGQKGNPRYDWGWPPSTGTAGGSSVVKLNNSNLVTCGGGGGAVAGWERYSWTAPTGGSVTIHQANRFSNVTSIKGANGVGTNSSNLQSVNGPFNNDYGRGGNAQAWGDNRKPTVSDGYAGMLNLKFLAPKEYGTADSGVKNTLDTLYNGLIYFMKY